MLDGVTSTGNRPCRLRSRPHHRKAADDPTTGCCSSVTSWSQDQTNKLRVLRIGVASHNSLGRTIKQHVRWQIMQLCKGISWQKEILVWRLGSILRCWVLTLSRHMSKLSATVATSALSQLGSSDTFCAVISRCVAERCADVSVSSW